MLPLYYNFMWNNLVNIYKWILIHKEDSVKNRALVGFIFKINPYENFAMMSDDDLVREYNKIDRFLKANNFVTELIRSKRRLTDFDYLDKYKELDKKKNNNKSINQELLRYLIYWNAKLIQSKTNNTFKHEYYIKVSCNITDLKDDKEIMAKRKEVINLLTHFPYIEEALSSYDVIVLLLKEKRFFKEELITLSKESLVKQWII